MCSNFVLNGLLSQSHDNDVDMTDPHTQPRDPTLRGGLRKALGKLRACLETSDWNIDIALFLTLSNLLWLGHLIFPWEEWEKGAYEAVWTLLTCMGALMIPPGITQAVLYPFILYHIVQILSSLSLLSGIIFKQSALLECWLVVNLSTCVLGTGWNLRLFLFRQDLELPVSQRFLLVVLFSAYYFSNGLYMWRIYQLRRNIVNSSSSLDSIICCPLTYSCCFACTAVCSLLTLGKMLESRLQKNPEYPIIFARVGAALLGFCFLLVFRPLCGSSTGSQKNFRFLTLLWSLTLIAAWIISGISQFPLIRSRRQDLFQLLILRFIALDLPASMSIFISYRRYRAMRAST